MAMFGTHSLAELGTCDPRLAAVCREVIQYFDFRVTEGHRSLESQQEAFDTGHSEVKPGHSKHNRIPSEAVDLDPWPLDFNKKERYYFLAGAMLQAAAHMGIRLRWGGDWDGDKDFYDQKLYDLRHFEVLD